MVIVVVFVVFFIVCVVVLVVIFLVFIVFFAVIFLVAVFLVVVFVFIVFVVVINLLLTIFLKYEESDMILGDLYGSTGGLDFCCIKAEELTQLSNRSLLPNKKGNTFQRGIFWLLPVSVC